MYPVVSDPEGYADVDPEEPSAVWADEYGIDAEGAESPEPGTGPELIAEDSETAAEPEGAKINEEQNSQQSPVTGYEDSVMKKNREEGAME